MGKHGKKQQRQAHNKSSRARNYLEEDESDYGYGNEESLPSSNQSLSDQEVDDDEEVTVETSDAVDDPTGIIPSKFDLYQQSVQSPKGDISYLQKFFLMYIGGRVPLHFQEDFCGTALLSTEWLRGDPRRTAVGIDLDDEALNWCVKNNLMKLDADIFSRLSLFHGNVLQPLESRLVKSQPLNRIGDISLNDKGDVINTIPEDSSAVPCPQAVDGYIKSNITLPARDIVCAFNYSCCCLHKRVELISYFKHVLEALSKKGGIFVMDLYGGTSSECELKLQRKFPNFTYTWEQEEFDIIQRKTRISLHFHLKRQQKRIRHAFSYSWRLWSLPEIRDCLEEAGFRSVHFWLRQMPDTDENRSTVGFGAGRDVKYEEVTSFQQQDAWNAYIVAVSN